MCTKLIPAIMITLFLIISEFINSKTKNNSESSSECDLGVKRPSIMNPYQSQGPQQGNHLSQHGHYGKATQTQGANSIIKGNNNAPGQFHQPAQFQGIQNNPQGNFNYQGNPNTFQNGQFSYATGMRYNPSRKMICPLASNDRWPTSGQAHMTTNRFGNPIHAGQQKKGNFNGNQKTLRQSFYYIVGSQKGHRMPNPGKAKTQPLRLEWRSTENDHKSHNDPNEAS
jgi:hypothetical protein